MNTCCATGSLSTYLPSPSKPWNESRIRHFYNRIGLGASPQEIQQALNMSPNALVEQIVNAAAFDSLPAEPDWLNWSFSQMYDADICYNNGQLTYDSRRFRTAEWIVSIADYNNRFRFKMALFWHNHFVTEEYTYFRMSYGYRYYKNLLDNALGNFKDFTKTMVTDPAMLFYLDGKNNAICNPGDPPNENFARELYELFTLGEGNYTDQGTPNDVHETGRALSGWKIPRKILSNGFDWMHDFTQPPYFDPSCHDDGMKTIFGITDTFGIYDQNGVCIDNVTPLIDHLFNQKPNEIATLICTKIYKEFIHPEEIDGQVIEGMKATFLANNFEILPVVMQLLKSEHFFDECFIGSRIKSPMEYFAGFYRKCGVPLTDYYWNDGFEPLDSTESVTYSHDGPENAAGDPLNCPATNVMDPFATLRGSFATDVYFKIKENGQFIFNPPNVKGWDGHKTWLSADKVIFRWDSIARTLEHIRYYYPNLLHQFMFNLNSGSIHNHEIAETTLKHFIQKPIPFTTEEINVAATVFAGSFPQEEFDLGYWSWNYTDANNQIESLLLHIIRLPEFQLC